LCCYPQSRCFDSGNHKDNKEEERRREKKREEERRMKEFNKRYEEKVKDMSYKLIDLIAGDVRVKTNFLWWNGMVSLPRQRSQKQLIHSLCNTEGTPQTARNCFLRHQYSSPLPLASLVFSRLPQEFLVLMFC